MVGLGSPGSGPSREMKTRYLKFKTSHYRKLTEVISSGLCGLARINVPWGDTWPTVFGSLPAVCGRGGECYIFNAGRGREQHRDPPQPVWCGVVGERNLFRTQGERK